MPDENGIVESLTRKQPRLTRAESFKAFNWVNVNMEKMSKLTRKQCADLAAHDLGLTINVDMVKSVVRDMGIEPPWINMREKGTINSNRSMRLARSLLVVADVVERILSEKSLGGLLPSPGRDALLNRLAECDIPTLQAIARKESIE